MAQQDLAENRRHGRLGSVVRITTALALGVLSLPLLVAPASAATVPGLLTSIDGVPPPIASGTDDTGLTDDIFQSSKENQPPNQWLGGTGRVDTGSDVTKLYTDQATDQTNGDLWFYLGYARSEAGVATSVVELNRLPDAPANGIEVPQRSPGDLRIAFTQDAGGAPLTEYAVQRWDGTGWAAPVALGSGTYRSATSGDGLFAEFAIDLSATGLMPSCDSGFTQINMRTRSSDKDNSELKDYVAPLSVSVQARCRAIEVEKYDGTASNHVSLGGARFQLWADNDGSGTLTAADTKVDAEVTADQGSDGNTYTWSDLPWGAYLVQETAAPAGYRADPAVHPVTLDANTPNNGTAIVDVDDAEIGAGIQVQKYDATTHHPLPGARFQLWADSDGNDAFDPATSTSAGDTPVEAEITADQGSDGNAHTWSGLSYGTYFVQETAAPNGYRLDPGTPTKVTLTAADAGSTVPVEFTDQPLTPTIVVTKTDADGHPVQGAGFTLWQDDGDGTFNATKDKPLGGQVFADEGNDRNSYTWNTGLGWGTYFVQETTVPAGYGTDPAATDGVKTVALPITTPGGVATVDFADPRLTAGITVHKYDFDSHDPLPGATFTLYTDDNGDGTLDSGDAAVPGSTQAADSGPGKNTATWSGLPWGQDYLVQETVAPAGYDTDMSADHGAKLVSLTAADAGSTKSVDFFDPRTPAVADPGTITVFKTDADTHQAVDGAMFRLYLDSNGNGTPEPNELRYSDPPRTAKGTYEWQVEAGTYLVEEASPPDGYLLPADAVQTVSVAAGGHATVTFADPQKLSTIVVTKTDATTGAPLDGATFTLTDADGNSLGAPTASAPGRYTWTDLRMGDYTVTETVPPPGYTLPAKASQSVDLDGGDAGSTVPLSFQDTQKTSTIVVHKYDADTTAPLDGATFTLTRDGTPVSTPPTRTGSGTYTWTGLPMGRYTVTETAPPPGYLPPDQDSLPAGASQDALFDGSTAGETAVLDFYDETRPVPPPPGTPGTDLVVTKVDQVSGDPLDTATFQLYGDDGDGVLTSTDPVHGAPQQTSDGQVRWGDLPAGTYFVVETAAPQGYRTADPLTVVVGPTQSGDTIHRQVADPRLPTTLQVLKVDDLTQQPLTGATFQAYADRNGDGRVDAGDRELGAAQVTNAQGLADWPGLGFGSYLLRETSAPVGYALPATRDQQVVVDRTNAGGVVQVVFRDPAESGFSITKTASERGSDGSWVPSDGTVAFGDPVRYQVTVRPLGSRTLRAVTVTDFVPGFAPGATGPKATYVPGTAGCEQRSCRTTYDAATRLVRWQLGDLRPGQSRTVTFVVRMPELPAHPTYVQGIYTQQVVNVATASWQQPVEPATARTTGSVSRSMRSNPVRTAVVDAPLVLGIPTVTRPRPRTGTSGLGGLPNTGAPAHAGTFTLLGWLSVICGGWLMLRRPGRGEPANR